MLARDAGTRMPDGTWIPGLTVRTWYGINGEYQDGAPYPTFRVPSETGRTSLHANGRGSVRLEWFRTLADDGAGPPGGLQLHTQLFTGYGDTLLDFNRRRTVFSVGLSLVDW